MSTPEERVQEENVDWRQALSDTYDEIQGEPEQTIEEPQAVEEPEVEALEEVEAVEAEEIEAAEEVEEVETVAEHATEEPERSEEQQTAFQYMPKEMREAVEKLDVSLQNEIINHHIKSERAYREKTMGFNDDVKLAKEVRSLLNPAALNGQPEQQYIAQLVQYDQALRSNPAGAIEQLARVYGYDLSTHGQEQGFTDPLQAKVSQLENQIQQSAQNAQQQKLQQAQRQIDDFAKDKPDFSTLEPMIVRKVQGGMDLQTAYDTVKGELGMVNAPKEPTQRVPIKQKKKAASGVKSTNATVQRSEPTDLRGDLEANWEKFMGSK